MVICLAVLSKSPVALLQVSLSSVVMPMVKMVPRGFTAAADAYLTPHILRCAAVAYCLTQPRSDSLAKAHAVYDLSS